MSIDTRFLKSAKDKVSAAARSGMQFAAADSRVAGGSPVAAITGMKERWKATKEQKAVTYQDVQQASADQILPQNIKADITRRYYAGQVRNTPNLPAEREALVSNIKRALGPSTEDMAGKLRYLSGAIHGEKMRTLSASEQLIYRKYLDGVIPAETYWKFKERFSPVAPSLNSGEILEAVHGQLNNEGFVRGMNARIMRMRNLTMRSNEPSLPAELPTPMIGKAWHGSEMVRNQMASDRPELFKSIEGFLKTTPGADLKVFTRGEDLLALQYGELTVPVVQKDGSVFLGDNFRSKGISRHAFTEEKAYAADEYAFEALRLGFKPEVVGKELQRINIYHGIDQNEDWSSLVAPAGGEFGVSDLETATRSKSFVGSELFGFRQIDKNTGDVLNVGVGGLDAENTVRVMTTMPAKRGLTAVGSESSLGKFVFQSKELENIVPYPINTEKQLPEYRAWTKKTRLTKAPAFAPGSMTKVKDSLAPFWESDYIKTLAPSADTRGVATRAAGISPGEQALFGSLPDSVEGLAGFEPKAVDILMKEHSIDNIEARKVWMEFSNWLSNPTNLKSMRRLGDMGEGGFLGRHQMYGLGTEKIVHYKVNEFDINDWQSRLGESINKPGELVQLGRANGNSIIANGIQNFIENVEETGDGFKDITVREVEALATGTKIDKGGIKGLWTDLSGSETKTVREGLNRYHAAAKTGGFIPNDVEIFQPLLTAQGKEDPRSVALSLTGDTFRRLQEVDKLSEVQTHLDALAAAGYRWDSVTGTLRMPGKDAQWEHTSQLIEDMFADVSERMTQGKLVGDAWMQKFPSQKFSSYAEWTHRYNDPGIMYAWDSTHQSVPDQVKVTWDMLEQLSMKGYHGIVADIRQRVKYPDGDPRMTAQLEKYMLGDKNAISQHISLEDAVGPNASLRDMSSPDGRAGTIFDPGHVKAQDNFVLDLPDGGEVPVLGHKAMGGDVNRYGAARYSPSESEGNLIDLIRTYQNGAPEKEVAEAKGAEYVSSLKQFIYGKSSYMRADAVDPMAVGNFLLPRASSLRYQDGSVNPFEMGIGEDAIGDFDEAEQAALRRGEPAFAALGRHPIADMPIYKLTIDKRLTGTNAVSISEGARALIGADYDKDPVYVVPVRRGSGEEPLPGWLEAQEAALGENSLQRQGLRDHRKLMGLGDDPTGYFDLSDDALSDIGASVKDIDKLKLKPLLGKRGRLNAKMFDLETAIKARSTAKSIGALSNSRTLLMLGLENNTEITDTATRQKLSQVFFQDVYQAPISSAKLKSGVEMDFSRALGVNNKLTSSLAPGGKFEHFQSSLNELAEMMDAATGRESFRNFNKENIDLLERFFKGFDHQAVREAQKHLTTQPAAAQFAKKLGMSDDMLPYLRAATTDAEEAAAAGKAAGGGAQMAAEALGVWNEAKSAATAAGRVARHSKIGVAMGVGVAIAMAAGIATRSIPRLGVRAVFGRDSANRYHPEDGAGVSNAAPGAASEGTRAAKPRRTLIPSQPQTRTSIVAPLGETADLDVRMRAPDRARAHETAKILTRAATDGDSNVTINYRDQKRRSLRARERMRDALDED